VPFSFFLSFFPLSLFARFCFFLFSLSCVIISLFRLRGTYAPVNGWGLSLVIAPMQSRHETIGEPSINFISLVLHNDLPPRTAATTSATDITIGFKELLHEISWPTTCTASWYQNGHEETEPEPCFTWISQTMREERRTSSRVCELLSKRGRGGGGGEEGSLSAGTPRGEGEILHKPSCFYCLCFGHQAHRSSEGVLLFLVRCNR